MTNKEVLSIALKQSAVDASCNPDDFLKKFNVTVISKKNKNARNYLELPFECNLISYGNNIVASVRSDIAEFVTEYINKYPVEHCFETPNLYILNDELQKHNLRVCFMAEYFLPNVDILKDLPCKYKLRILFPSEFTGLYKPEWSNALCEKRKQYDVLAVGAFENNKLVGLAGASADCDSMWQIGVDVLPEYRRMGVACAITSRLALEILSRGKVPFYCAAWSNIKSVRNAIKSGFYPAWAELTAKDKDFVAKMSGFCHM